MKLHHKTNLCFIFLSFIIHILYFGFVSAVPGSTPDTFYPIFITIDENPEENIFIFTDHTSDLQNGNWIELLNGEKYPYPTSTLNFDLTTSIKTVDGKSIKFETTISSKSITYPLSTHSIYKETDTIHAKFWGSTNIASDTGLEWRLIDISETEIQNAFSKALDGDPSPLKSLLSNTNAEYVTEASLNTDTGDATVAFPAPSSGLYYLILVSETSNPYQIVIYGITFIQVLEYDITTSNPTTVTPGSYVDANIEINNPPSSTNGFIYGVIMIHENSYSFQEDITFDGTVQGSVIEINDEIIVQGSYDSDSASFVFPGFSNSSDWDTSELAQIVNNIFGSGTIALGFSETSQTSVTVSLSTSGLNLGSYRLLYVVWEDGIIKGFDFNTLSIVLPNADPVVQYINEWVYPDNYKLAQGGDVSIGKTLRIYSQISDLETPSGSLEGVTISYRPQSGSWVDVSATHNPTWDYWFIDWVIPGDATPGLYDVKVYAEDGDGGSVTDTDPAEFNVVVVNNDPVIMYINGWVYPDNYKLAQGGSVETGKSLRIYSQISDLETPSGSLEGVTISYRPQSGSWVDVSATHNPTWDYWFIDWVIPGDATPGLYDVKVYADDGDGGSVTDTDPAEFNVVVVNNDPVVGYINEWVYPDNYKLAQGGSVETGKRLRIYSQISDLETASGSLEGVTISYRPQSGSWVDVSATHNPTWDYWFIDWVIPGDATPGLYDVKVYAEDGDGGSVTDTDPAEFNVVVVNNDPVIMYINGWVYPDNYKLAQGGDVSIGKTLRIYSQISDLETASGSLEGVTISYRPQSGSWVDVSATHNPTWDYWFIDWVIPGDATPGLYDVKVYAEDGDDNTVTESRTGHFTIVGGGLVVFPGANWEVISPEELGMSASKLDELESMLGGRGLVVKDGYVVKTWGDQDTVYYWASSSKPVISTLLFYAIEEGKIESVDSLVGDWGWELYQKDQSMTFRHLANMVSGYARPEASGEYYAYNDRAIQLYFLTIERVFKQSINDAALQLLHTQLQLEGTHIFSERGRVLLSLPDFARICWFWLNRGNWDGDQILPELYFDQYMRPGVPMDLPYAPFDHFVDDYLDIGTYGAEDTSRENLPGPGIYGFNWWFNAPGTLIDGTEFDLPWPDAPTDAFMSRGKDGAHSVMIPSLGVVVVTNNGDWGSTMETDPEVQSTNDILKILVEAIN